MNPRLEEGPLSARALLRWQFRIAHELLETAIERLSTKAVHQQPPRTAPWAGACYAQVVLCEDLSINGVLAAGTPLAFSTWVGRTGISEMPSLALGIGKICGASHVGELRSTRLMRTVLKLVRQILERP
jgi:hypothetical protein